MLPKGGIRFLLRARQRASCTWEGIPPAWPIFNSQNAAKTTFRHRTSPSALPNPHCCPHALHDAIRHLARLSGAVGKDSVNEAGIG